MRTWLTLIVLFGVLTISVEAQECVCSDVQPPSDEELTCEEQRDLDRCTADWMRVSTPETPDGFCLTTCGFCPCPGSPRVSYDLPVFLGDAECTCSDLQPTAHLTCVQQKEMGYCLEDWMRSLDGRQGGFCQITCGFCPCSNPKIEGERPEDIPELKGVKEGDRIPVRYALPRIVQLKVETLMEPTAEPPVDQSMPSSTVEPDDVPGAQPDSGVSPRPSDDQVPDPAPESDKPPEPAMMSDMEPEPEKDDMPLPEPTDEPGPVLNPEEEELPVPEPDDDDILNLEPMPETDVEPEFPPSLPLSLEPVEGPEAVDLDIFDDLAYNFDHKDSRMPQASEDFDLLSITRDVNAGVDLVDLQPITGPEMSNKIDAPTVSPLEAPLTSPSTGADISKSVVIMEPSPREVMGTDSEGTLGNLDVQSQNVNDTEDELPPLSVSSELEAMTIEEPDVHQGSR